MSEKKPWHAGAKSEGGRVLTVVTTLPMPFNTFFVAEEDFGRMPVPMTVEIKQDGIIGSQQVPLGAFMQYVFREIWVEIENNLTNKLEKTCIENVTLSEASFLMYPVAKPLWWDTRKERK